MGTIIEEARNGNLEGVRRELENGADINQLNPSHDTALTWAAYSGHTEVVRFLIEHGADPGICNGSNTTPLQIALANGRTESAKILQGPAKATEVWRKMGHSTVAHVGTYPEIGQTLTTIFNFKSRDQFVIARNISSNAQSQGPATSFDALPRTVVEEALEEFTRLGGTANRDYVLQGKETLDKPKARHSLS